METDPLPPIYAHQREAIDLLKHRGSMLWHHGMGAGKTRGTIEYIREAEPQRTLVLCPKAVVPVWGQEIAKYDLDVPVVAPRGSVHLKAKAIGALPPVCVVVLNFDACWRQKLGSALAALDWDLVVLDECHRIRGPQSKVSKWCGTRLAPKAKKRLGLTGTPTPNSGADLFAQARFLDVSIFGLYVTKFRARYCVPHPYIRHATLGMMNVEEMAERIAPLIHRVRIEDVVELHGETHSTRPVELPAAALREYKTLNNHFVLELTDGVVTAANAAVKAGKLRQVASGFCRDEDGVDRLIHMAKVESLADLLTNLEPEENVVVFATFRKSLDLIHQAAETAGRSSVELSGRKNEIGATWCPALPGTVAAINWESGSTGIDLTAASVCVCWEPTYALGSFEQGIARLNRKGQSKVVRVVHLVSQDTIDVHVSAALQEKGDIIAALHSMVAAAQV